MTWLDDVKARLAAATNGPWFSGGVSVDNMVDGEMTMEWIANGICCDGDNQNINHEADAAFIAHARTDLERAVAEIEALRDAMVETRNLLFNNAAGSAEMALCAAIAAHAKRMEVTNGKP